MKRSLAATAVLSTLIIGAVVMLTTPAPMAPLRPAPRVVAEVRDGDAGGAVRAPNPWFFLERAYPLGQIPRDAWKAAQARRVK